jgi:hypothetical protein
VLELGGGQLWTVDALVRRNMSMGQPSHIFSHVQ